VLRPETGLSDYTYTCPPYLRLLFFFFVGIGWLLVCPSAHVEQTGVTPHSTCIALDFKAGRDFVSYSGFIPYICAVLIYQSF
jgi:hypothetical protein